jgi:hypothetical protein
MNRRVLTFIIVLGMGIALGAFFLTNRSPGALAEVVQGANGQTSDIVVIEMCAPTGYGLANGQGPARALVQINSSTELLDQRKRSPAKFRPEVLESGSRVRIWVLDQMLTSDPPQLVATRISLIADPVEGRSSECG